MSTQNQLSIRSYPAAVSRHAHDFHQLILPVEGRMELDVGGVAGRVDDEAAALVVGGTAHGFHAEGENRFLILDLVGGPRGLALPDAALARARGRPFFAVDPGLRHLCGYVAHALAGRALPRDLAHSAIELVIESVMRARGAVAPEDAAVSRAVDLIHARYAAPLSMAVLARAAGLSASALHERFRRATGRTPFSYLQDVRLDAAERLLRRSQLSIVGIALSVGFSDQTALTRCLRRRRGVTPGAVRRARQAAVDPAAGPNVWRAERRAPGGR
ncbi:MAG: AraC family transcriptional regulator [Alphaproteobacteria bacterium]|nr:AraC family transcriptional regulator [Alphaproteobacteria bacterium]